MVKPEVRKPLAERHPAPKKAAAITTGRSSLQPNPFPWPSRICGKAGGKHRLSVSFCNHLRLTGKPVSLFNFVKTH